MRHHYWEAPIVIYLFLGGLGGGIFLLSALFNFLICPAEGIAATAAGTALFWPVFIAIAALGVGCFFLVFELGQPMAMPRVFLKSSSIICWGARLLVVAMVFGLIWWISYIPFENLGPLHVLTGLAGFLANFRWISLVIAGIAGTCIMLYTGIMLSTLKAHSFWATPALPVLFTVSATSTACAAVTIFSGMLGASDIAVQAATEIIRHMLHTVDIILVIVELTVLMVMILSFLGAGNKTANKVAHRWIHGKDAMVFWVLMISIGLVLPLFINLLGSGSAVTYVAPTMVLIGGITLRYLCVYSDDRAPIPGEEDYWPRLPKRDAEFMNKWTYGENIF